MAAVYPTVANCKAFMVITAATDDATITFLVDGAISFVERYCGRSFLDVAAQTIYVMPTYPNLLNKRTLLIKDRDLVAVTSITNGDGEAVTAYRLLPLNGPPYYQIEIHPDAGQTWNRGSDGEGVVTIVGTIGYKASVPDDVFMAVLELVAWLYRARSSGAGGSVTTATRAGLTIAPSELPPNIREVLDQYKRLKG